MAPHTNPKDHPECEHCGFRQGTQDEVDEIKARVENAESLLLAAESRSDALQKDVTDIRKALVGNAGSHELYEVKGLVVEMQELRKEVQEIKSGRAQAATIGTIIGGIFSAAATWFSTQHK